MDLRLRALAATGSAVARRARDFQAADRLRAEIEAAGWKVVDAGTLYSLERAAPPTVEAGGVVRYGSSASVPSRLDEAPVGVASVVLVPTQATASPTATASPSCVAQSVAAEHQTYGSTWGRELIAFLATHPQVLQSGGFDSFGRLASFAAQQDHAACPEDL